MIATRLEYVFGNIRIIASRARIALIILAVLSMPSVVGCRNATANTEMELRTTVETLNTKIVELQNKNSEQEARISEQQSTIDDLSKSPHKTPWYQKFIDWLAQVFGRWVADKLEDWVRQFLSAIAGS